MEGSYLELIVARSIKVGVIQTLKALGQLSDGKSH